MYAFIIDRLHTSQIIIYVTTAFARTFPGAHISLLTTTSMIIFPLGKADPENVSSVMSRVCEWYSTSFPSGSSAYVLPSTTRDSSEGGSESMSPLEHEKGAGQEPQHGLPLTAHMQTMALAALQLCSCGLSLFLDILCSQVVFAHSHEVHYA